MAARILDVALDPGVPALKLATDLPPRELSAVPRDLPKTRATLALTRRQQQSAEAARRELISFLSDELRTPLAGLRALAEGLEDGLISDVPGALGQLRATIVAMTGLVADLVELTRADDAEVPEPPRVIPLGDPTDLCHGTAVPPLGRMVLR